MENTILYKYRSLENFQRFMEILIDQQIWADVFTKMNDPNEGYYLAEWDKESPIANIILKNKQELRFCCFSKCQNIGLQWSLYADGLKGVVVGVEVPAKYEIKKIDYKDKHPTIEDCRDPYEAAKKILQYKLSAWAREKEVRVFAPPSEKYIDIVVRKIILGSRTPEDEKSLIKDMVDLINEAGTRHSVKPIEVSTISEGDLDYS